MNHNDMPRKGREIEMPCITNREGCRPVLERCSIKIVQSSGGVLIRTDEEIRSSSIGDPDTFDEEKVMDNGVLFLNFRRCLSGEAKSQRHADSGAGEGD